MEPKPSQPQDAAPPARDKWGLPIPPPEDTAEDAEIGLTTTEDGDWQ